jgi:hypothetical protein
MRISTAVALAALGAMIAAGCGGGKSSGSAAPAATTTTRPTRTTRRPSRTPVTAAPSTFTIKPLDEAGRAKIADNVCGKIADERKQVIEGLVHQLLNGTVPDKIAAAEKLGELADPMAVPFLMTSLTGETKQDPNVRLTCVDALGNIADPASAKVLIYLLDDDDLSMAQAALDALSVMTEADPPYAFVEGSTIKIRKDVKAEWNKKLEAGYFKELKQDK